MSKQNKTLSVILFLSAVIVFASCDTEDPGPLQEVEKEYSIVDFDRLEMSSALNIRVEQSNTFSIEVRGDRRNINDLDVFKSGSTLIVKFDESNKRRHDTYVTITMPRLRAANFSGTSVSKVKGFAGEDDLDFFLSGASVSQLDVEYGNMNLVLSGASGLNMYGSGGRMNADISGASVLTAFDYPVREATVNMSGASAGKVNVTDELKVVAAGASSLLYRGTPSISSNLSGASTIQED